MLRQQPHELPRLPHPSLPDVCRDSPVKKAPSLSLSSSTKPSRSQSTIDRRACRRVKRLNAASHRDTTTDKPEENEGAALETATTKGFGTTGAMSEGVSPKTWLGLGSQGSDANDNGCHAT